MRTRQMLTRSHLLASIPWVLLAVVAAPKTWEFLQQFIDYLKRTQ